MKIEGSGTIWQRHGSADPHPDPHQNVMDPRHCYVPVIQIRDILNSVSDHPESGYSIFAEYRSGSRVLMIKNWKNLQLINFLFIF
jgi:hypothetical protein